MSRRALSELCGLSKNAISRFERGEREPSLYDAKIIADFFDVSLDYLYGDDGL
jgi:transcriptional regulator with XRE-family HTH domain